MRTLLVLRHADTEHVRPGAGDHDRRLTPLGLAQAAALGDHLRAAGVGVDLALCSSAVRARQTLDAARPGCAVQVCPELYNAGAEEILEQIRQVSESVRALVVVGHAPGLPALTHDLADPATSEAGALEVLERQFPPCTLATLRVAGQWSGLRSAALEQVRLA